MMRFFIFLVGYGLMIIGLIYIVSYLNVVAIGGTYRDYLYFIIKRLECWFVLIGFIIVTVDIFFPSRQKKYK